LNDTLAKGSIIIESFKLLNIARQKATIVYARLLQEDRTKQKITGSITCLIFRLKIIATTVFIIATTVFIIASNITYLVAVVDSITLEAAK